MRTKKELPSISSLHHLHAPFSCSKSKEAIFDCGASYNYVRDQDKYCVTHIELHRSPLLPLPDTKQIRSTEKSVLPLSPDLTLQAQSAHILPDLKSSTLISVGQLCDDECDLVFGTDSVRVLKDRQAMNKFLSTQ